MTNDDSRPLEVAEGRTLIGCMFPKWANYWTLESLIAPAHAHKPKIKNRTQLSSSFFELCIDAGHGLTRGEHEGRDSAPFLISAD